MIAKVKLGRSFGGVVGYLFEGHYYDPLANKQAEILAANGVRTGSIQQITTDFNRHRRLNPDLGVAVWHTALSFHADDQVKLSNKALVGLAKEYMRGLELDPSQVQWLLVKHNDTRHPHVHLLMNRVDGKGQTIDAGYVHLRSIEIARDISTRNGLTIPVKQRADKRYGQVLSPERVDFQEAVREAVLTELPQSGNLEELAQRLWRLHHISVLFQRRKKPGKEQGMITGLAFSQNGHFIRGSGLGSAFSAGALAKQIDQRLSNPVAISTPVQAPAHAPKTFPEPGKQLKIGRLHI
jgi:hypothetical protein